MDDQLGSELSILLKMDVLLRARARVRSHALKYSRRLIPTDVLGTRILILSLTCTTEWIAWTP